MSEVIRVREPFSVDYDGAHHTFAKGVVLNPNDPRLTPARIRLFCEPIEAEVTRQRRVVEDASAEPNAKRTRTAPARKPRGKK